MKKKNKIKKFPWEKKILKCDQVQCENEGNYQAPKSVNSEEKYNFCLEHVKAYNKRWDFFAGKSQAQIYNFLKNDQYYNKPTKPISERISSKISFDFSIGDEGFFSNKKEKKYENKATNELNRALSLFNLELPIRNHQLKKKYNDLVKKNHPDLHQGDSKKEDLLKKINIYYKLLKKIAT